MNGNLTLRRSSVSFPSTLAVALGAVLSTTAVACGGGGSSGGGGTAVAPATAAPGSPGTAPNAPPAQPGATPNAPPPPATGARMGMNLGNVSFYSPDWVFVDVLKVAQVTDGFPWQLVGGGSKPALDAEGYPRGLGAGQAASTITMRAIGGRYPGGVYTLLYEGDGDIQLGLDAEQKRVSHDGRGTASHQVAVTPSGEGIQVRITRSNPSNHVRNVRLLMPGFDERTVFHPTFLERLQPFAVLRFMDWGRTNRSPVARWSDRVGPGYRSQGSTKGVAWEYMIQLSNLLKKDPWICVPHAVDDDYVRKLAAAFRDGLDPQLRVHIEYSNEVWNGIFSQAAYVKSQSGKTGRSFVAQYVARSVEIFRIFEQTFGGTQRLVRVIAGQSNNLGIAKQAVAALPAGAADALAIAPYFGGHLGSSKNAGSSRGMSVDRLLDACAQDIATTRREEVRAHVALARTKNLELVAYEGGQHLSGVGNAANDAQLTNLFIAANRHPRMKQLYRDYLAMWKAEGGGLFVAYSLMYTPSKHGSWGALERQDQTGAPKYDALVEAARAWHGR